MGKEKLRPRYIPLYHPNVKNNDLPKLHSQVKDYIKLFIETKLIKAPEFYGIPLRSTLNQYWKHPIGAYRLIYKIKDKFIIILAIKSIKDLYHSYDLYLNQDKYKSTILEIFKKNKYYIKNIFIENVFMKKNRIEESLSSTDKHHKTT